MQEDQIVGLIFLIFGGLTALRPDVFLKFQVWVQKTVMGATYSPTKRTRAVMRIIGLVFVGIGLLIMSGVLSETKGAAGGVELQSKKWEWMTTMQSDGSEVHPREQGAFTITFLEGGRFDATTDCNSMGGRYTATKSSISFEDIEQTLMYCEGSQEGEFAEYLRNAHGYHFSNNGTLLVLDLNDSGLVVFR